VERGQKGNTAGGVFVCVCGGGGGGVYVCVFPLYPS
jgi:hypothetical protein